MISKCGSLEDLEIDWAGEVKATIESYTLNSKVSYHSHFQSLWCVSIIACPRLKDLTWLVFAPNLKALAIEDCDQMQEVIGTTSTSKMQCHIHMHGQTKTLAFFFRGTPQHI